MANRESSPEMSSLAARVLQEPEREGDANLAFNALLKQAKSLAGSVMAQDEHKGQGKVKRSPDQGTHAFDLIRDMEAANVDTTETLIHMVAATVLAKLIEDEGGGRANITFGPQDMDAMHRDYELEATRDGLLTTVRIKPRPEKLASHQHHDIIGGVAVEREDSLMAQVEDVSDAKPQVEAKDHNRPVWAIRYFTGTTGGPHLAVMHDRADAERHLLDYAGGFDNPEPIIENRMCLHIECPTEHCTHAEVTSEG